MITAADRETAFLDWHTYQHRPIEERDRRAFFAGLDRGMARRAEHERELVKALEEEVAHWRAALAYKRNGDTLEISRASALAAESRLRAVLDQVAQEVSDHAQG